MTLAQSDRLAQFMLAQAAGMVAGLARDIAFQDRQRSRVTGLPERPDRVVPVAEAVRVGLHVIEQRCHIVSRMGMRGLGRPAPPLQVRLNPLAHIPQGCCTQDEPDQ
jgi:hypothetical protein